MNVYLYAGRDRFSAWTQVVPDNEAATVDEPYYVAYDVGMLLVAYPNLEQTTNLEFTYQLVVVSTVEYSLLGSQIEDDA